MKNFKFSVVMPVYNVEDYLEESIVSLIDQTIGFEENIQLILVNDGSPDNSGAICEKYRDMYPDNIVYICKQNEGVSVARNVGMEYAVGEYLNFLDSDDKWDADAFEKIAAFFDEHRGETDVVTGRLEFFDAERKRHVTNYRLEKGTRVADLTDPEEYDSIVLQVASSFFRTEAAKRYRFVKGLKYGEDSMFANSVIMEKMKVGFVEDTTYWYRRRKSGDSAVQSVKMKPYYFLDRLEKYLLALEKLSAERLGSVVPYIQNVVYYDFAWHLLLEAKTVLSEQQYERFMSLSKEILSYIDDSVIVKNTVHTGMQRKIIAYAVKHDGASLPNRCYLNKEDKCIYFGEDKLLCPDLVRYIVQISFCSIKGDNLVVEGQIADWIFDISEEKTKFFFKIGKAKHKPKIKKYAHSTIKACNGDIDRFRRFICKIPLNECFDEKETIRIEPTIRIGKVSTRVGMKYGKFVPSCSDFSESYRIYGPYYLRCLRRVIKVTKADNIGKMRRLRLSSERKVLKWLKKNGMKDLASLRKRYFMYKLLHPNADKIWLFSDRVENAGDNAEVFFKYVRKIKPQGIRPIFVISKNAECVERLKSEGEVVFFEDDDYLLYFLLADKIISSGASDFTTNPFGARRKYVSDLFRFKYYYLQHGVACADLSPWLHRYAKNIDKIFASSAAERDAFLSCPYYYGKNNIELTGQARFDDLYVDTKKQILILPTWRKSIKESYDSNTTSVYFDGFKETEYFRHFNSLINHPRLLDAMRRYGYTGLFCIHPIHMKQSVDFESNDVFTVNDGYVDYNKTFAESALMVTDYSSVLFDFAYLRKSVVYTHFDKKAFFKSQIYDEGYFSYENDGFGPVCYDLESTVDAIIEYIKNDCKNPQKYLDRVNRFFEFSDQNNSERTYKAIMGIKE